MKFLNELVGVDIYLIDQLMKGNIQPTDRILDAGCGKGRNLSLFLNNKWNAVGIDPNELLIQQLRDKYPESTDKLIVSTIEDYEDSQGFDVIICNAVLHFAENHAQFDKMIKQLDRNLRPGGMLFIRMTSNIGIDTGAVERDGVYHLPDNSYRYLITKERISELVRDFQYELMEPVKTVNVSDLRCMTTLVFRKTT